MDELLSVRGLDVEFPTDQGRAQVLDRINLDIGNGEVVVGVASINESAVTGESAPVIRAAGSDFDTVTGGTLVLSDWVIVRISVNPGEAFLDRRIGMVEGAKRRETPNGFALTILFGGVVSSYTSMFIAAPLLYVLGVKCEWGTDAPVTDGAAETSRARATFK